MTINRPEVRDAIDREKADALAAAFRDFDADDSLSVAVLTGAGGCFCAGADLGAVGELRAQEDGDAPLGVSRLMIGKPVIAAVEGHAVAGGLEVALWCDLRVAAQRSNVCVRAVVLVDSWRHHRRNAARHRGHQQR